jgi:plasmid stabilization system protein ParE
VKDKIKKIEITQRAQADYDKLIKNIEEYSSPEAANRFDDNFYETLSKLKKTPLMFEASEKKKGARRALFDKYGAFLYKVIKDTTLRVIAFYDTRMNR